jgi:hypothetical protein
MHSNSETTNHPEKKIRHIVTALLPFDVPAKIAMPALT